MKLHWGPDPDPPRTLMNESGYLVLCNLLCDLTNVLSFSELTSSYKTQRIKGLTI